MDHAHMVKNVHMVKYVVKYAHMVKNVVKNGPCTKSSNPRQGS